VPVAAAGIRLPDLDQGVGQSDTGGVQHPAFDDDALADWLTVVLGGQVMVGRAHPAFTKERAGDLGQSLRKDLQRLFGVAQRGALVPGEVHRRVDPGGQPIVR
jgi:hypothetical protein